MCIRDSKKDSKKDKNSKGKKSLKSDAVNDSVKARKDSVEDVKLLLDGREDRIDVYKRQAMLRSENIDEMLELMEGTRPLLELGNENIKP